MAELMDKIVRFLKEKNYTSPWLRYPPLDIELVQPPPKTLHIPKGDILFHQHAYNECCYVVKSGRFRIFFIDSSGTENCLFIAQKGCLIGELPALDDAPNCVGAVAILDASVYSIPNRNLRSLLYHNPDFGLTLLRGSALHQRMLTSKLEHYNKSSAARVAISLLSLCVEYGKTEGAAIRIGIRFTHEELANLTGLNRVTVSRIYLKLQGEGVICRKEGDIVVCKPEELMKISD